MPSAFLSYMLAEEMMHFRIEDTDVKRIPLNLDHLADPSRRNAVIGRLHFDASIQMHDAFAVLVVAERFQRQWKQERRFFCKHRGDLSLRGAVNACIGPAQLPVIEIGLRLFETFETH